MQSCVHGIEAACPDLDAKLVIEPLLQQVVRTVRSAGAVSADPQLDSDQPQQTAIAAVCTAVSAQCADQLADVLDALAAELSVDGGLPAATLVSGSTVRLAAFCNLLAEPQPNVRQEAADDELLLKAWAQAYDQLAAMSLPDATSGLRWLLQGLPRPLPTANATDKQGAASLPAAPLSATARAVVVRDATAVLSDVLTKAEAVGGGNTLAAAALPNGAEASGKDARAGAAALLQDLRMQMLVADSIAAVQARCVLPEAASSLVEAALELAAEGRDGLEASLQDCLQVWIASCSI